MPDSEPAGHDADADADADEAARTENAEDEWPQLSPLELAVCLADGRDRRRRIDPPTPERS